MMRSDTQFVPTGLFHGNPFPIAAFAIFLASQLSGCAGDSTSGEPVVPAVVTEKVPADSDDPAIWINPLDSTEVLILGTDKGGRTTKGGLYAFNLEGKIVGQVDSLQRPNNVDVAYLYTSTGQLLSLAVCTERDRHQLRVFRLPDLKPLDHGGIPVFEGEADRDAMGIALYTDPETKNVFAVVGRKEGPETGYLWQYQLSADSAGLVSARFARRLGHFSGKKEIESIAIDNELGYIYYSDEEAGVRKYYAHPDSSDRELSFFATEGFAGDHEGISIYKQADGTGFILVSNQQDDSFHVYPREGTTQNPHDHPLIGVVHVSTAESDGSDVTSRSLPGYPQGLFVAMSTDGTFQYYRWEDLLEKMGQSAGNSSKP